MAEDLSKTLGSKEWRLNNLYKIKNKHLKLVTFKMNVVQQRYFKERTNRNITVKARQLGISTFELIDALDDTMFNENFTSAIVADKKENVIKLFNIIKTAIEHLPTELDVARDIDKNSSSEISFKSINSNIYVATSTRSGMVNRLHVSELGKMSRSYPEKAEEVVTGAFESVPLDGRISVESTAEGFGGHFFDLWTDSPQNGFKGFFHAWFKDKEYQTPIKYVLPKDFLDRQKEYKLTDEQINWYYFKSKTLKRKLAQEYPCCASEAFLQGGRPVFDSDEVKRCNEEEPIGGHSYGAGIDTATGAGLDFSVLTIIDKETGLQVMTYRSKEPIIVFANKAIGYCLKYNEALLNIELNGVGESMMNECASHHSYDKLYQEKTGYDQRTQKWGKRTGTYTTRNVKENMIESMKEGLRGGKMKVSDEKTYFEILAYQYDDSNKMTAPAGGNDDGVMAYALAVRALEDVVASSQKTGKARMKKFKRHEYSNIIGV